MEKIKRSCQVLLSLHKIVKEQRAITFKTIRLLLESIEALAMQINNLITIKKQILKSPLIKEVT